VALALYRKYRPRSFAEVIGQEHVTEPLMQALRSGRLNHAYLFSGPRGCGKTSSARILARSLNCERGPTPDPCGDCESCRALAPDGPGSIDVIEIDAASHGGVDDARELRERAFFAPAISRFKVYIIDEAHMVSPAGFNALLKLVEEPPDYVKFVFATTEPEKVLGTIKSRTHHYPFRLIPPGVLRPYMEKLCEAEGVTVDPKVLPLVVRAGAGFFRDSLSVLDQLIAGAGPEGVTYTRAVALLGVTDAGLIDDVCDALAVSDAGAAFAAIERVVEAGHDPRRFTADLLERLRDLILLRQVPEAADKGLIDAPADQLERMQAQAQRIGPATLTRWAEITHNGLVEMRGTTSTRLLLELITARMLLPTVDSSDAGVLSRLERLEQGIPASGEGSQAVEGRAAARAAAARAAAPAPAAAARAAAAQARVEAAPQTDTEPDDETPPWEEDKDTNSDANASRRGGSGRDFAQVSENRGSGTTDATMSTNGEAAPVPVQSGPPSGEVGAPDVRRAWDEIVQLTGRSNKRIAAMARDGVVRDVEGSTIVLVFKAAFHANSVGADPAALLDAIHQVIGGKWQLRCEVGGDQRGAPPSRSSAGVAAPGPAPGGGRAAGKAAGSPPVARSASPTPAESPDPAEEWPATAPIGSAAAGEPGAAAEASKETAAGAGGVAVRTRRAAPPVAAAAERAVKAPKAAQDDFGPLDEPPYDPEFDGHIEDSGGRGGAPAHVKVTNPPVCGDAGPPRKGRAAAAKVAARAASRGAGPQAAARLAPQPAPAGPELGFDPGDEPTDEVIDAAAARQSVEQQAIQSLRQQFGFVEKIADL
jgi:DNA polymerase III subunit gamma/tau